MNKLGDKHIAFMRQCTKDMGHTHAPEGIDKADLDLMVREGLLIEYRGPEVRYAITKVGKEVASSFGESPDLIDIAVKFVMTKGYDEEGARKLVAENGAEFILKAKAAEERGESEGQREIKAPMDFGLNIKKSF